MTYLNTTFFFAPNICEEGLEWIRGEFLALAKTSIGVEAKVMRVISDMQSEDCVTFAVQLPFENEDLARAWAESFCAPALAELAERYGEMALCVQSYLQVLD